MLEINQENLSILAEVSLDSYMYKTEHKLERQEEVLMEILSSNKNTEFGRQYKFEEILSAKQYASQVPVFEYADLKPYIERMKTEKNILFHDEICYWAMTSGTSGTHKYIPHTEKSLKNWYRGAFRAISSFIKYYPECNVPTLKCLTIVGPAILEKVGELSAGYISGIIPFVLEELRHINICNEKINEIADYTEKMNMILKIAVRNPKLFAIGGISTFSIHFLNYARDHAYDVLKGEPEFVMIQQYFNEDHTLNLRKLWPEFQLFFSTGVSIEGYREQLKSMFPNLWIANVYAGTEGAYAFNKEQEEGLYLNFDLYYFEFREVEIGSVLSLNEVSIGKSYEVILTTHNGLYRYTNGDIVEFVSIDPPKIKVVGRSNLIMNLAGEKLSDSEVSQALQETDELLHTQISNYCFFGWMDKDSYVHHCMAIELSNQNHEKITEETLDVEQFSEVLFERFKENRASYRRSAGGLFKKPHVVELKRDTFSHLEKKISNQKGVIGHSKLKHILRFEEAIQLLSCKDMKQSNLPKEILEQFRKEVE